MKRMYALMVVPSNFPNADAGAVRDLAFAKIYQKLGYEVVLIGMGQGKAKGTYDEVVYYSLYRERKTAMDHFAYYFGYKNRCQRLIKEIIKKRSKPAVIHINDISHGMIRSLISFAEKESIPIIHDSTEWYSPCEFKKGKYDKSYLLKDRLNRKVIREPVRVIAISDFLRNHFEKRGLQTVRIPVIMDVLETKFSASCEECKNSVGDKIRFIYAGSPASKDHLKEIIDAVYSSPSEVQDKIELHLFGVDKTQLCSLAQIDNIPSCVNAYGRVPREMVLDTMGEMDFSLLLRPAEERYAKAGFPTKSVEAMSHGVAMMCNVTSDLGLYLKDGENAVIVENCSVEAVLESFEKVAGLSRYEIDAIKRNARKLAEDHFDYRGYVESVRNLIDIM